MSLPRVGSLGWRGFEQRFEELGWEVRRLALLHVLLGPGFARRMPTIVHGSSAIASWACGAMGMGLVLIGDDPANQPTLSLAHPVANLAPDGRSGMPGVHRKDYPSSKFER